MLRQPPCIGSVTLTPDEVWKGNPPRRVMLSQVNISEAIRFERGRKYFIFGYAYRKASEAEWKVPDASATTGSLRTRSRRVTAALSRIDRIKGTLLFSWPWPIYHLVGRPDNPSRSRTATLRYIRACPNLAAARTTKASATLEHVRDLWTLHWSTSNCTAAIWRNDFGLELRVLHGDELIESRLSRFGEAPLLLIAEEVKANLIAQGWSEIIRTRQRKNKATCQAARRCHSAARRLHSAKSLPAR